MPKTPLALWLPAENQQALEVRSGVRGAASVKPTVFSQWEHQKPDLIWRHTSPGVVRPTATLRGFNRQTDEFCMAGAKKHPSGLSPAAIAQAMLAEFHRNFTSSRVHFWGATANAVKVECLQAMHVYNAQIRAGHACQRYSEFRNSR